MSVNFLPHSLFSQIAALMSVKVHAQCVPGTEWETSCSKTFKTVPGTSEMRQQQKKKGRHHINGCVIRPFSILTLESKSPFVQHFEHFDC